MRHRNLRPLPYFLLAFRNVGLVPDGGATVLVPLARGSPAAGDVAARRQDLLRPALAWGLINATADGDQLAPKALGLARRLAARPPEAQADIKRILNARVLDQLTAALELATEIQSRRSSP